MRTAQYAKPIAVCFMTLVKHFLRAGFRQWKPKHSRFLCCNMTKAALLTAIYRCSTQRLAQLFVAVPDSDTLYVYSMEWAPHSVDNEAIGRKVGVFPDLARLSIRC